MTEKEVSDLLLFMVSLFGERLKLNQFSKQAWFLAIGHIESAEIARAAVVRCAQVSPYPPTPAEILKQISEIAEPSSQIDGAEAWGLAIKACRLFGARREKEGLLSLPGHVREVVKHFGWNELCLTENLDVARGEFLKMYASFTIRRQQQKALPPVSEKLTALANKTVKALKG